MQTQRFDPGLKGNNPGLKKPKAPAAPKEETNTTPVKTFKAHVMPVLHARPPGKKKGFVTLPTDLLDKCGADAFVIMGMINDQAPTFQMNAESIAARTGLSLSRTNAAITALVKHGYAYRIPNRQGGLLNGNVIQTNVEGNIVPLPGSALHYSVDEDTAEAARRPVRRKEIRWEHNPSAEDRKSKRKTTTFKTGSMIKHNAGNSEQEEAPEPLLEPISQGGPETGGPDDPPLASPIMLTPSGNLEQEPIVPLAAAKRISSFSQIRVDGVDLPLPRLVEDEDGTLYAESDTERLMRVINTPALKRKLPLPEGLESMVADELDVEIARQLGEIRKDEEAVKLAAELEGVPLDPAKLPERVVEFDSETFRQWRYARCHFGVGDLGDPRTLEAAHHLIETGRKGFAPDNFIARGLLAPKFCLPGLPGEPPEWDDNKPTFHSGYERFSSWTEQLAVEDPKLGLEDIPKDETRQSGAHLWLYTHKLGMLFMTSISNPDDLTDQQANRLLRQLRKGSVTEQELHRLWMLTHFGQQRLTATEAIQLLGTKQGVKLDSGAAVEGYRAAMRRMVEANKAVCPEFNGDTFHFDDEEEVDEELAQIFLEDGRKQLADYERVLRQNVDMRYGLQAVGVDAWNAGDMLNGESARLACLWLAAHVDQNHSVIQQLTEWGAVKHLHRWTTKFADGRQWLLSVECTHGNKTLSVAQTLGWGSGYEWDLHMELFRYGMRKSWSAFVDTRGCSNTVWSGSLFNKEIKH